MALPIEGVWYNELNSSMTIQVNGSTIVGTYTNAAGPAAGDYDLVGVVEPSPKDTNQAVAWTVTWVRKSDGANFHSVTAWSGQFQIIDNEEVIIALWLLTSETEPTDDWTSTTVGQDTFSRTAPSDDVVKRRAKLAAASHPNK